MLSNEEIKTLISDWSEKISAELEKIETSESPEELCNWIQRTGIIFMGEIGWKTVLETRVQYLPDLVLPNCAGTVRYQLVKNIHIKALNVNPKMVDSFQLCSKTTMVTILSNSFSKVLSVREFYDLKLCIQIEHQP